MSIISKKTIFAPITPVAMSAVGVIRISGERTFDILSEIFSKSLKDVKSHTVHHGYIKDGDKIIDDVLVAVFRSPRSYTGEDVAEISCHGSPYVLSSVQDLLLKKGAVLAKGGEFSRRAFLNGKMDVTQAEAIIDLIESESEKEASVALDEIGGTLSRKIEEIRESLLSAASHLLAYVDYPDDGIEDMSAEDLRKVIEYGIDYKFYNIVEFSDNCEDETYLIYSDNSYNYYLNCANSDGVLITFVTCNKKMNIEYAMDNNYIDIKVLARDYPDLITRERK